MRKLKRLHMSIMISLAFLALCGTLFLCEEINDKREKNTNIFYHYYTIEPASLLEALEAEDLNVFIPIDEEPTLIPPNQRIPVSWTQDDYLIIVDALFQLVQGSTDTMEGWQINSMQFALGCTQFGIGLQDGNFRFFKIVKTNRQESRIERIVNIDPRSKVVFITENDYYPILANWSAIDLGQNLLSADEILQIADNAGGREKRVSIENACDISLLLSPDYASYNGWEVSYYRRDNRKTIFHVEIDPITGKIR